MTISKNTISYIGWEITTQCNFHCPHCYTSSTIKKKNEFTFEQCKQFLDNISEAGIKQVALSGGEPLLRPDLVEILKYGKTLGISFSIVTNGSLGNEKLLKQLKDNNLKTIQVSLDGPDPESNSSIRACTNEQYYQTLQTIKISIKLGLNVYIGVFLHKETIERLGEFVKLAETLGVLGLRYAAFLPVGRGKTESIIQKVQPTPKQLVNFIKKREEIKKNTTIKIMLDCASGPAFFMTSYNCSAGEKFLYVEADGDVFPCTTLCSDIFKIGNVFESSLVSIINQRVKFKVIPKNEKKGRCSTCGNTGCFGGCPGVIYAYTNRVDESLPNCIAYKSKAHASIRRIKKVKEAIIVLSHPEEYHAKFIFDQLIKSGENAIYLNWKDFPSKIKLTFSPTGHFKNTLLINNQNITAKSIYWRWFHGPTIYNKNLSEQNFNIAYKDSKTAIEGFMDSYKSLWVNPPESYYLHWCKPKQLAKFRKAKIPIPKTIISNDIFDIHNFIKKYQIAVINKPVQGGYPTKILRIDQLDLLATTLTTAPVAVQEYIEGVDIRVYIIGNDLFAMKIGTTAIDFCEDKELKITPIDVPEYLKKMCFKIAKLSKYIFAAIDIKQDKQGNYFFIEANPSPMFIKIGKESGYPLTDKLTQLLIRGKV